jgi:dephospho-CoA kinase
MRAEMEQGIAGASDVPAVVIDAAILYEAGWDDMCTHTVFVDAPAKDRYRRVGIERGWTREEFDLRESAQIPLDIKAERCFYTVDNHSDMSRLSELVRHIFHQIVHEG